MPTEAATAVAASKAANWRDRCLACPKMHALLVALGDKGACRHCRRPIYYVRNRTGHVVAYSTDGVNHTTSCPALRPEPEG